MPLPYTKLDLGTPVNALFKKCKQDKSQVVAAPAAAAAPAAGGWKGASGPTPQAVTKGIIADCINNCKEHIDKQAAIYVAEEKDYASVITKLHADAKPVCQAVITELQALQQKWDDKTFQEMGKKVTMLQGFEATAGKYAASLSNHLGFRGNRPWLQTDGVAAVGKENEEALAKYFQAKRAAGIDATAKMGPVREKISEFETRGNDCYKTATALKTKSTVFTKELAADADKILTDAKQKAGAANSHSDKGIKEMQDFIVLCNKNQNKVDAAKLKLAQLSVGSTEMKIKNDKTYLKTLKLAVSNFKSKATGQPVPPDVLAKIKEADTALGQMEKDVDAMKATWDTFKNKVGQAKS